MSKKALLKTDINNLEKTNTETIRIIDLFAGIGGIRLGFEQAIRERGLKSKCVFTSEIKPYAIDVYKLNFNNDDVHGDITKIESKKIPDFDFLLAGFPCQPFSSAGKGLGFADTRGTLFFEIERILKDKQPYGFLLENVEGLVNHNKGQTLSTIINHLEQLNYKVNWKVLDSKQFGMAQSRKRIYIVGTKNNKISLDNFEEKYAVLKDILETGQKTINSHFTNCLLTHYTPNQLMGKAIKDKRGGADNIHSWDIELKGKTTIKQRQLLNILLKERRKKKWAEEIGIDWMDGMPLTTKQISTFFTDNNLQAMLDDLVSKGYLAFEYPKKKVGNTRQYDTQKPKGYNIVAGKLSFEFSKILNPNDIAPTLVAMDVSHIGVIDNDGIRRLTKEEGLKLCGYDTTYTIPESLSFDKVFDLLGNTVCVPVIKAIAHRLLEEY